MKIDELIEELEELREEHGNLEVCYSWSVVRDVSVEKDADGGLVNLRH